MADTQSVIRRYQSELGNLGRAALSALYPNDFEYYAISLELTTFNDSTIDYFIFPIMPKNISKSENHRINVKKTLNSTVVIQNSSFIPHDITLKGDFGRTFKILLQPKDPIQFTALRYSIKNKVRDVSGTAVDAVKSIINDFNPSIKTGYGAIKILQSIIDKSRGVDADGMPFKLYLYNPALGESYLAVPSPNPLSFQQSESTNMIWNYTLNLTVVAQITSKRNQNSKSSFSQLLAPAAIQKSANKVAKDITNSIR